MTDPHEPPTEPGDPAASPPAAAPRVSGRDDASPPADGAADRALTADPNRPADPGWREPPWIPSRRRDRDRRPGAAGLIVGVVLVAIGLYWFIDRTLGIDLPDVSLGRLWPVILIILGGLILLRSLERRR